MNDTPGAPAPNGPGDMDQEPMNTREAEHLLIPDTLPVLPLREVVIYPHVVLPLAATTESELRLVNDAVVGNRLLAVAAVRDGVEQPSAPEHLYDVGCAVVILKMAKFPDGSIRVLVQGLSRITLGPYIQTSPYLVANIQRTASVIEESIELQALAQSVIEMFNKLVDLTPHLPDELKVAVLNIPDKSRLADVLAATLNLTVAQRQEILETLNVAERFRKLSAHLSRELHTAELSSQIQSQVRNEVDKDQRDYILRRQLKAIQAELGEADEQTAEINEIRKRVDAIGLPPEARKEVDRELARLKNMPPQASEYHVARTYIEWVLALPWTQETRDKIVIAEAEAILDADHYDLAKVKQRILEYLAVRKLKKDARGPILCFVGPPGTGKTSLGRSIARALGRKFVRISLGGVRDEAEIRGHRRTYVGALPGRIIQGLRKAESRNPVFMLDEVDKLRADFQGDPAAALLEVLDPEQNFSFTDHYLDVPFDLSHVLFIATANILDTIPPPLLDRMEVLELPGYTLEEKTHIARKYLIPRQIESNGLRPSQIEIPDPVVRAVISDYTREAGLRNLERSLGTLCRKRAAQIARAKGRPGKRILTPGDLQDLLGPRVFLPEMAEHQAAAGVATGLAWTPAGGEILFIESTRYPGPGKMFLTGKLGDVMKESAQAALSYIRTRARRLGISTRAFANHDLHVHVPAGAIPKDGPSAGVTLAVSMISLFINRPVRSDVAMTGEITLRGRVLPVGGIKEKVLAAQRAGIRTVLLPKRNEKDLIDVPDTAKQDMTFIFVETVDDILPVVFGRNGEKVRARRPGAKRKPLKPRARRKGR